MKDVILTSMDLACVAYALNSVRETLNEDDAKVVSSTLNKVLKASLRDTAVKLNPVILDTEGKEVVF